MDQARFAWSFADEESVIRSDGRRFNESDIYFKACEFCSAATISYDDKTFHYSPSVIGEEKGHPKEVEFTTIDCEEFGIVLCDDCVALPAARDFIEKEVPNYHSFRESA